MPIKKSVGRRAAFRLATSDLVERVVLGLPPARALAFRRARRYVAGRDEQSALATVRSLELQGLQASIDLFGENVFDASRADTDTERYLALAATIADHPGTYLSLDCSHFGLDDDPAGCLRRVERIARALPTGSRLQLGAEESTRTDAILEIALTAAGEGLSVMATIQANLHRSVQDVERLVAAEVPIRLSKGAYVESAEVAFAWGPETDAAFVSLAERLHSVGADHALATHDPSILNGLLADRRGVAIEFLLGVRREDAHQLVRDGHHVRMYVPYGERWFRYYARRVAESIGA